MAKVASSSSASIAPLAAMMAETPQMEDPTASRLVSLGLSRNQRPSRVMMAMATASSIATSVSETPPSLSTSPSRKRAPSSTMPALSQKSYVATPGRNICATPTVFAITMPNTMAQSTYSMFGSARWCALP